MISIIVKLETHLALHWVKTFPILSPILVIKISKNDINLCIDNCACINMNLIPCF